MQIMLHRKYHSICSFLHSDDDTFSRGFSELTLDERYLSNQNRIYQHLFRLFCENHVIKHFNPNFLSTITKREKSQKFSHNLIQHSRWIGENGIIKEMKYASNKTSFISRHTHTRRNHFSLKKKT